MKKEKKQNIVPLKDLNLTDRFLFDEVLEDRDTYQDILSIIFGRTFPFWTNRRRRKNSGYPRCSALYGWMCL